MGGGGKGGGGKNLGRIIVPVAIGAATGGLGGAGIASMLGKSVATGATHGALTGGGIGLLMGGKGAEEAIPAPPPVEEVPHFGGGVGGIGSIMAAQQAAMDAMMGSMLNQPLPDIYTPTHSDPYQEMDWGQIESELSAKARADEAADAARRKGRTSTILTSPLLDYEDVETTESVLAGGE